MQNFKFSTSNVDEFFDKITPFTIGFDKIRDQIQQLDSDTKYPPYNIVKLDDNQFMIEIAAAGFRKDEFNVHLVPDSNKLVVQGVQDRGEDKSEYFFKGIGARNFTRVFTLAEEVKVLSGDFVDGMLLIKLERIIPEEKKPQQIIIK